MGALCKTKSVGYLEEAVRDLSQGKRGGGKVQKLGYSVCRARGHSQQRRIEGRGKANFE